MKAPSSGKGHKAKKTAAEIEAAAGDARQILELTWREGKLWSGDRSAYVLREAHYKGEVGRFPDNEMAAEDLRLFARREAAFLIICDLAAWRLTKNPFYIWRVINCCEQHRIPYPRLVHEYLAEGARRLCSDEARRSSGDLGRVLPKLLGFQKGRGNGRLLDPGARIDDDKEKLVMLFAWALQEQAEKGAKLNVSAALQTAQEHLPPAFQATNDSTLKGWIEETLGLPHRRRTAAEWDSDLQQWFSFYLLVFEFKEGLGKDFFIRLLEIGEG